MRIMRRRFAWALPAAAVAALGVLMAAGSCSDPGAQPADGGPDSYGKTRRDAGPPEAGPDTGAADAALSDGTVPGFVDGWVKAPWSDPGCGLYQPADKAMLAQVPPLHWKACSSGRPGCQQLVQDWTPVKGMQLARLDATRSSQGDVLLFFGRDYAPYQREFVLWRQNAGIIGAWRHDGDDPCLESISTLYGDTAVLVQSVRPGVDAGSQVKEYREIIGTADELLAKTSPDSLIPGNSVPTANTLLDSSYPGKAYVAHIFDSTGAIVIENRATKQLTALKYSGQPLSIADLHVTVNDDGAVFFDGVFDGADQAYVWDQTNGVRPFRPNLPQGTVAHDLATDGTAITWIESSNNYASNVLYTSPYTPDPASVQPVVGVGEALCGGGCGSRMSDGYLMWGGGGGSSQRGPDVELLRLADGTRRELQPVKYEFIMGGSVINDVLWSQWDQNGPELGIQQNPVADIPLAADQ